MHRHLLLLGLAAVLLSVGIVFTGCSVEEPLQGEIAPVKRKQQDKAPAAEALLAKAQENPAVYDASGRRDPFKPLITPKKAVPVLAEEGQLDCPPLQDFELASLKLVGTVWGEMGRKAMLKAPDGRGYAITENMLVGRNCARVRRIESNEVIIEEIRRDGDGNVLKEEVVLRLRERDG